MKGKGCQGYTLVEVIVGLTIALLLLMTAGNGLGASYHMFSRNASAGRDALALDSVCAVIREQVGYADALEIYVFKEPEEHKGTLVFTGDGRFLVEGVERNRNDFKEERSLICRLEQDPNRVAEGQEEAGVLELRISLERAGEERAVRRLVFRLPNLKLEPEAGKERSVEERNVWRLYLNGGEGKGRVGVVQGGRTGQ